MRWRERGGGEIANENRELRDGKNEAKYEQSTCRMSQNNQVDLDWVAPNADKRRREKKNVLTVMGFDFIIFMLHEHYNDYVYVRTEAESAEVMTSFDETL